MARAVAALSVRPHYVLIDGRDLPDGLICPARPIIDGDALSMSIAAASIVAKTMRDALMRNLGSNIRNMVSATMSAMRLLHTAGLWPRLARVPITGARSGSSRETSDSRPKQVSKALKSYIR